MIGSDPMIYGGLGSRSLLLFRQQDFAGFPMTSVTPETPFCHPSTHALGMHACSTGTPPTKPVQAARSSIAAQLSGKQDGADCDAIWVYFVVDFRLPSLRHRRAAGRAAVYQSLPEPTRSSFPIKETRASQSRSCSSPPRRGCRSPAACSDRAIEQQ